MLHKLFVHLRNWIVAREPTITMRAPVEGIDDALTVVKKAGYQVHVYSPELGTDDLELAKAFRVLARSGQFIVTDQHNDLLGKVYAAQTGSEVHAQHRRAQFKIVE
ncbi:hypothetical protein [Pseudomonas syringae]|uniref:hypothetical protein n=1 Tax=Pseudomonas syringae TaxID=317 RepID=UPI0003610A3B|nr:hypothetical protein [Pseudomonas syringae]MDU8540421.1 hypothetical protein [Pseudomonas syringae pv. actinidiae]